MIKELKIVGFKSFLNRTLLFRDLTVLTGLNSSGKSSVIQALLILEKAKRQEKNILLDGHGSLEEILNTFHNKDIELSVVDDANNRFATTFRFPSPLHQPYYVENPNDFSYPEIIYISANRFGPKTYIPIYNDSNRRNIIGPNGENLFQFIQSFEDKTIPQLLIHPDSEGETLEYNIRAWLKVICPNVKFRYEINKYSDTAFSLFNEHRATNVGFGLSYSLSVIASLLIGSLIPNSLVIIENPEAHLHPRGQSEIANLICLCSMTGTQVLIETHSDHIFDRIRVCAKKYKDFSEKVQLHWFELNNEQITEVTSPEITSEGRLEEWPKGLFDEFEINASELL